jgi:hypothetical protein
VYKEKNEVRWSPVPLETLLDVDAIVAYWAPRGMVLHRTPSLRPFPDLTQPDVAYPQYPLGSLDPNLVVRCGGGGGECCVGGGEGPAVQGLPACLLYTRPPRLALQSHLCHQPRLPPAHLPSSSLSPNSRPCTTAPLQGWRGCTSKTWSCRS